LAHQRDNSLKAGSRNIYFIGLYPYESIRILAANCQEKAMPLSELFPRTARRVSIVFIIALIALCSTLLVSALARPGGAGPTVTIDQFEEQPDPTDTSPIIFTVIFSAPVTGFQTGDVTLSGTAGATTATVFDSGDSTVFIVAVSGMTANGTVIATIPAGVATDTLGNPNQASTSTDNTVTFNGFVILAAARIQISHLVVRGRIRGIIRQGP